MMLFIPQRQSNSRGSRSARRSGGWSSSMSSSLSVMVVVASLLPILLLLSTFDLVSAFSVFQTRTATTTRRRDASSSLSLFDNTFISEVALTTRRRRRKTPNTCLHSSSSKSSSSVDTADTNDDLPANLKRKVTAKRPPLGHVIPKATKIHSKKMGGTQNPKLRPQGKAREAGLNNPSMLKIFGGVARGKRLDSPTVYLRPMMGKVREAVYSALKSFGVYDDPIGPRHLDLFAGSGSVGLESLSRGASHCTFCDFSQDCCNAIQRNIDWCQFGSNSDFNNDDVQGDDGISSKKKPKKNNKKQYHHKTTTNVICADVLQLLRQPASVGLSVVDPQLDAYDIVTICPPYEEVVYADLLDATAKSPLVKEDTIVLIEYPVELWGDIPHVYRSSYSSSGSDDDNNGDDEREKVLIGIRNRKYGRTVIGMYICNPSGKYENADSRPEEFI